MSHQVLARKWRPQTFREMVGQEHVLKALVNALDHDRLHHAYLFTGTRGVGKTTVARVLAKCLNCETGVSSEPCGQCSSCREITEGRSVDLIEVDAASRTKVEDTRDLLENVQYAPTHARYKVYLIDEVHMLSTSSFNALLKTLEEPPPHVIFLLATTDPQKLPMTVLSRCLQFNLKNMPVALIVDHLKHVLDQEMVSHEEPALSLLARAADGSMRDALSLTDQAVAFGNGKLVESDVRNMLGTVDLSFVYQLLESVVERNAQQALNVISAMSEHAPDYAGALDEMASLLHRVAIAQAVPDAVDDSWGDGEKVTGWAQRLTAEDAQLYYQLAVTGRRDIGLAPEYRIGMEMTILRMIAFQPAVPLEEIGSASGDSGAEVAAPAKKQIAPTAEPPAVGLPAQAAIPGRAPAPVSAAGEQPEFIPQGGEPDAGESLAEPPRLPLRDDPGLEPARWPELLDRLELGGLVYNVASHCELRQVDGDCAHLVLDGANASLYNQSHAERIAQALSQYLARSVKVAIEVGVPRYETPAGRAQRLLEERQASALDAIESDPKVQLLLERFEGTIDRNSVTPIKH
jgi:DNA polymerase-3 subunit gamma/tau